MEKGTRLFSKNNDTTQEEQQNYGSEEPRGSSHSLSRGAKIELINYFSSLLKEPMNDQDHQEYSQNPHGGP